MLVCTIAKCYSRALFKAAASYPQPAAPRQLPRLFVEDVLEELEFITAIITDAGLVTKQMLSTAAPKAIKEHIVLMIGRCVSLHDLTLLFLQLLIKQNRLAFIASISKSLRQLVEQYIGILQITVKAPLLPEEEVLQEIKNQLEVDLQKQVKINVVVDSKLLGGFVIQIGSKIIDYSFATKLRKLERFISDKN